MSSAPFLWSVQTTNAPEIEGSVCDAASVVSWVVLPRKRVCGSCGAAANQLMVVEAARSSAPVAFVTGLRTIMSGLLDCDERESSLIRSALQEVLKELLKVSVK